MWHFIPDNLGMSKQKPPKLKNRTKRPILCCRWLECSFISLKSLVWLLNWIWTSIDVSHPFSVWQACLNVIGWKPADTSLMYSGLISSHRKIFIKLILSPYSLLLSCHFMGNVVFVCKISELPVFIYISLVYIYIFYRFGAVHTVQGKTLWSKSVNFLGMLVSESSAPLSGDWKQQLSCEMLQMAVNVTETETWGQCLHI